MASKSNGDRSSRVISVAYQGSSAGSINLRNLRKSIFQFDFAFQHGISSPTFVFLTLNRSSFYVVGPFICWKKHQGIKPQIGVRTWPKT